jgi:2,5-dihydroxypyridine 5,6-dioxygenase
VLAPNQSVDAGLLASLFRDAFVNCDVVPGETVAVVSGPTTPPGYVDAALAAAAVLGARPFGIALPGVDRPADQVLGGGEIYGVTGLSNLSPAVEALKLVDFAIDFTALLHSAEHEAILAAGTRMLWITEPPEILQRMYPSPTLKARVQKSVELLTSAKQIHITSDAGTDVTMPLGDFGAGGGWGWTSGPGTFAHWPSGLASSYPNDGQTYGRVVIDRGDIVFPFKTYVQHPIVLEIADGFIKSIEGEGIDAELYRDYLEQWDDPEGFAISHIGWGLNERAHWNALATLDRAATQGMDGRCFAGNVLFSTGPNNEAGGSRFTLAHSDVPLRNCNVWLDSRQILDRGIFVVEELAIDDHYRLPRKSNMSAVTV